MKAIIDSKEFTRIIKALKPFTRASHEKMQYIYITVDSKENKAKLEALDGHRIAVEYVNCDADEDFTGYIKPFTMFTSIDLYVELEKDLSKNKVFISHGDYTIGFVQPDGTWYNTKNLLEDHTKENKIRIGVDADLLIDALKHIKKKGSRSLVILEATNPKAAIVIKTGWKEENVRLVLPVSIPEVG